MRILCLSLCLAAATLLYASAPPPPAYRAKVAAASDDYQKALAAVRVPAGMKIGLWAAEPLLANPVVFTIDHRNRVYVAETFRLHQGVTDIRGYLNPKKDYWLDEDLACRTVEDRIAMTRRKLRGKAQEWERHHDRVRLVEDADGDGKADRSTVFAEGFSRIEDGLGSGLLARGDTVWYTCIPDLWRLRDPKGTGSATERTRLSSGYGVRYGFIGHDLHGLIMGPDGKIYFSIGDRGLNVPTPKGRLEYPDTGSVLRCNPDGTDLEVFASGLRNPQELAFDDHGNLFTGDNNSDGGDRARWVYLLQGGDCGWRIGYQFDGAQGTRGPWNAEKMWHAPHPGQPAWIVPPIVNVGDGPSGLVCYPGVGLPDRYKGHFFLADFRGGPANSGIRSFTNRPKGAGFELADSHEFIWGVLATDVDFTTDGAVMVSDWTNGWGLTGKGRLWRVSDEKLTTSQEALGTKKLLAEGFTKRDPAELARLMGHPDRRVRQEAHFELAARGPKGVAVLAGVARDGKGLARLHALWGLGIAARNRVPDALTAVPKMLEDADPEVRAQALRVLGEGKAADALDVVVAALKDESARVQSFAAMALSKLADANAVAPLAAMLRTNADADPWLRHCGVMGLTACADAKALNALVTDISASVRRASLLAMRRQGLASIVRFLDDADPEVVTEAARAINDAPINDALPNLAALITRSGLTEPALYRVLNANFRLGSAENAAAVARFAARADAPPALRREALKCLEDWTEPGGRDRVIGVWRPLPPREPEVVRAALRANLAGLFGGPDAVRQEAARVAAKLGIKEVGAALFGLVSDAAAGPAARAEALAA
ncbi:MAG: PVC-type heme-binding CxxCH protein, partial [Gemmataceae bacterium]